MDALALNRAYSVSDAPRAAPLGKQLSLSSLGYTRAGLDDAWQACGSGWNRSFHRKDGLPLVNLTRFPNITAMTSHAHANGLKVGWYLNNCFCAEHGWSDPAMVAAHYHGDISALVAYGFDGAKFDACGQFQNLTRWEELLNASGRPIMVENCHWGGDIPYITGNSTRELWCPYNIYRSGMDIVPNSWASFMTNLNSLVPFLHHEPPLSRPGCWAYPDSVQTGSFDRLEEDRTNFGAWCITSSPLILGMDVTSETALSRVWSIVANTEAIAVNQRWAGHPGRLVRQKTKQLPVRYVHAKPCNPHDKLQQDWVLGPVASDNTRAIHSKSTGLCVDAWSHELTMEPCTNNVSQQFVFDNVWGTVRAPKFPDNSGKLNGCLDISGKVGPIVQLTRCYGQPNDFFDFRSSGVWADRGGAEPYPKRCMQVENGVSIEAQLWAKPQPGGAVAVFAFNAGTAASASFEIDLVHDLGLQVRRNYSVRDIWAHKDMLAVHGALSTGVIANHDSRFYVLKPLVDEGPRVKYV